MLNAGVRISRLVGADTQEPCGWSNLMTVSQCNKAKMDMGIRATQNVLQTVGSVKVTVDRG